ncbi:MAG: hypothetical protein ABIJ18_05170 [archaeon]
MKKGQSEGGHIWIYYTLVIFIIAFMFFFFRAQIQNQIVQPTFCLDDIENNLIMTESIYSSECFAYYDEELKRTIPGTIDKSKFTEEQLATCFQYIQQDVQLRLGDTTIGEEISEPETKTRIVRVYDQGTITFSTLELDFQKKKC